MLEQREVIRIGDEKALWRENSASGSLLFTYHRLTEKDLDFFEKLPITFRYEKEGYPAIICCHGSPINSRELLQLGSAARVGPARRKHYMEADIFETAL